MPPAKKQPEELNLIQSIAKIMGEMEALTKTGGNKGRSGLNYTFLEINEILNDVRPRLANAGIVMFPTDIEDRQVEFHPRQNGGISTHAIITVVWEVTNGDEKRIVKSVGEAIDTSDKAFNKAQTAAEKQALQKLLLISNEEDNDSNNQEIRSSRQQAAPSPSPSPAQPPAPKYPKMQHAMKLLSEVSSDSKTWPGIIKDVTPAFAGVPSKNLSEHDWSVIAAAIQPLVPSRAPTEVAQNDLPEGWSDATN